MNYFLIGQLLYLFIYIEVDMQPTQPPFTVNGLFQNMRIRIVGSPEIPFFYANDLCSALKIVNITHALAGFGPTDIVSSEQRRIHKITTYKPYGDTVRVDNTVALLTERGAYRLIISAKGPAADDLRNYVFDLLEEVRRREKNKLILETDEKIRQFTIEQGKREKEYQELKQELKDYEKNNPCIYAFHKSIGEGNPYFHIPARDRYTPPRQIKYEDLEYDTSSRGRLYKYTTRPTAQDYTDFTFIGKIYGISEDIMGELQNDGLRINDAAYEHSVYVTEPLNDDIPHKIARDEKRGLTEDQRNELAAMMRWACV
jgi:prophage antirepressor-like protein